MDVSFELNVNTFNSKNQLLKDLCKNSKMESCKDPDISLITFLRKLANSIENRQLLPIQLQKVGEFFMTYQFQEQAIQDKDESGNHTSNEFSKDELLKFIVLGWYIYCCILDNKSINYEEID